jgi:hypothetical protein
MVIGLVFLVQGLAMLESHKILFRRRGAGLQRIDGERAETVSFVLNGAGAVLFLGAVAATFNPGALPVAVGVPLMVATICVGLSARILHGEAF